MKLRVNIDVVPPTVLTWFPVQLLQGAHFIPAEDYSELVLHLAFELLHRHLGSDTCEGVEKQVIKGHRRDICLTWYDPYVERQNQRQS